MLILLGSAYPQTEDSFLTSLGKSSFYLVQHTLRLETALLPVWVTQHCTRSSPSPRLKTALLPVWVSHHFTWLNQYPKLETASLPVWIIYITWFTPSPNCRQLHHWTASLPVWVIFYVTWFSPGDSFITSLSRIITSLSNSSFYMVQPIPQAEDSFITSLSNSSFDLVQPIP